MVETLFSFALATIALAISPGPDNIYVLTQSLTNGVKSGVATTAGLISGCIVHTSLLAFGISAIITASETLFFAIKLLGALYLFYLAFKVFRSDSQIVINNESIETETLASAKDDTKKSYWVLFKTGVIMNLVNPKVMIFFLAFFPAFIWEPEGNTVYQFYVLGITFMLVSFVVFSSIALLAGAISSYIKKYSAIGLALKWLQIVVFVGIGVFILL
ncbi:MAG: threonine/homoserine/homoserine lactone efflux protein [Planctomycetota bacterium]|jgi:threonine/homoserine/homoserine lactone efflux protein|uniref:LysE family translocator n=1 Tax=Patiriisocius sp. Uisw_047 TaxID=3230969 RepID=UPI0039EA4295